MPIKRWMRVVGGIALVITMCALFGNTVSAQDSEGDLFILPIEAVSCEVSPAVNPDAQCEPTVGAAFDVATETGDPLDSCTTEEATIEGGVVGFCSVEVPFETTVVITEDVSTIPEGYAPIENPMTFQVPATMTDPNVINFFNVPQADGSEDNIEGDDVADDGATDNNAEGTTELPSTGSGMTAAPSNAGTLALLSAMAAAVMLSAGLFLRRSHGIRR